MFEGICISRQDPFGMGIDLGFLAEALVFYQRTHVVAGSEMFKTIVRVCGYDVLIKLMEMGTLTIDFLENIPVVSQDLDFGLISGDLPQVPACCAETISRGCRKVGKGPPYCKSRG